MKADEMFCQEQPDHGAKHLKYVEDLVPDKTKVIAHTSHGDVECDVIDVCKTFFRTRTARGTTETRSFADYGLVPFPNGTWSAQVWLERA